VNRLLKLDPSNTTLLAQKHELLQQKISETKNKLDVLKEADKQAKIQLKNGDLGQDKYDALQREIIETEQQLKNMEKTTGSGSAALEKVSNVTGTVGKKMKSAGQDIMPASVAMIGLGAASVSTANDFESAMSQAAGALNMPMTQMGELRELAIQTGQDTIFSAKEAGQAITELAKGGLTEADIKGGALKATMDLAASSGMDLGNAANVVVQAMGAFGLSANDSAQAANALAGAAAASSTDVEPLTQGLSQAAAQANNAGWSIQETTAVLGKFADAGINGSDAGTSLKTMLQRLAAPTDKAAGMIEELGIQTRDSNEELLGASDMAEELQNKLGSLSSAQRDAALQTIFGSDATRAATVMMNSGAEGLASYITATNDQEAAQRLANSQMGEGQKAIEEMKGSLETAAITIGEKLAPVITEVVEFITNLVNKFSELPSGVQTAIVVIGALVAAAGPLLMIIGQLMIGISAITGVLSVAAAPIGMIIAVIAGVIAAITAVIAIIQNWGTITEWFGTLWNTVCVGVQNIWQAVSTTVSTLLSSFVETIKTIWNTICTSVTNTMNQIRDTIISIWTAIKENPIVQIIADTVQNIFTTLSSTLSNIWNNIKSIASNAWELIKNVILGPVLLLIDLVTGDFESLKSDLGNIWSNISNAANSIWSSIKDIIATITSGIRDTVSQIWNGIKDFTSTIWDAIKNTISDLVSGAKDAAVNGFNALKDGVNTAITELPGIVSGIFEQIKNIISGLIDSAFTWGSDFISGLKDGIMSGVSAIVDTVQGIGEKIRSYLHFSRPDVGPLRDYETWMPDFMDGMTKGIYAGIPMLEKAAKAAATAIDYSIMKSPKDTGIDYNQIYKAVRSGTQQNDIILVMKDREVGRALREMGVVFG
jgi:TP901 family phage tail tape measure protein